MKSNAKRLALLLVAFLVLIAVIVYAVREPGTQWSSFMMGVAFAVLVCRVFSVREEEW